MRKGFTLIELLVASILLGMVVTILTMIFNQSSIAWRTGVAGIVDLDTVRETAGQVRNEADNLYIWKGTSPRITSIVTIWRSDAGDQTGAGKLRNRAIDLGGDGDVQRGEQILLLKNYVGGDFSDTTVGNLISGYSVPCGSGDASSGGSTYTVNVRSAGPDRKHNTYDDIWSYPDDFDL